MSAARNRGRPGPATPAAEAGGGLVAALARPDSYPGSPDPVRVLETHISWVFLAGERAFKLKKPVVLDFLDYGTPERRREMCRAEVELNRRLAPDLYLGVRGVRLEGDRVQFTAEDDPQACDYVVEMRRYDERDTLAARLERGELRTEQVREVGARLAAFHAAAAPAAGSGAPVLGAERTFERNLHELLAYVEQRAEFGRIQALERFAHAFVTRHAQQLQRRAAAGRIRDGHGDLRAEHVLVNGAVAVVDCVEFEPAFRCLDVADDLAFLVCDLAANGGEHFGPALVEGYREAGGDAGSDALIAFYATYRALVRAKVALVRAAQLPVEASEHGHESARARDLIALAERFAWRARLPLCLVVCGAPASGKSHLAETLGQQSGFIHISSDRVRKRLAGVAPTERAPAAAYDAAWSTRTYGELGARAARELRAGRGVIVDATFRRAADRRAFAAAMASAAPQVFIECRAPRELLVARARQRVAQPGSVSDADAEVVAREAQAWEPLDEVPAASHLITRSDRDVDEIIADLLAVLDQHLLAGEP